VKVAELPSHDAHFHSQDCGHFRRLSQGRWIYFYQGQWEFYDESAATWFFYRH